MPEALRPEIAGNSNVVSEVYRGVEARSRKEDDASRNDAGLQRLSSWHYGSRHRISRYTSGEVLFLEAIQINPLFIRCYKQLHGCPAQKPCISRVCATWSLKSASKCSIHAESLCPCVGPVFS